MRDLLKSRIPLSLLTVSAACAGAVAPVADAQAKSVAEPVVSLGQSPAESQIQAGAILLDVVRRDPLTGEMVAGHYSHASHASHASHSSHYSSRY